MEESLDKYDRQLLAALQSSDSINLSTLAQKVNLSASPVLPTDQPPERQGHYCQTGRPARRRITRA